MKIGNRAFSRKFLIRSNQTTSALRPSHALRLYGVFLISVFLRVPSWPLWWAFAFPQFYQRLSAQLSGKTGLGCGSAALRPLP
jgi:hypothetical protein